MALFWRPAIGDVRRPDVVRPRDAQVAQQVGIDLVGGMPLAGVGLAVQRMNIHLPHQCGHMTAAGGLPFALEQFGEHPRARERVVQMQLADAPHQGESFF